MRQQRGRGLFTVLLLVVLAWSTTAISAQSDIDPKQGTITGDEVNVRGGAGKKYKSIGRLDDGTSVRILGREGPWYEIVSPVGTSVWIYGRYVEREENEDRGTVTGTDVNVRPLPRADRTNAPLGQVSSPSRVRILGKTDTSGDEPPWYRIEVPEGISSWVHADYVQVTSRTGNDGSSEPEDASQEETSDRGTAGNGSGSDRNGPEKGDDPGTSADASDRASGGSAPEKGTSPKKDATTASNEEKGNGEGASSNENGARGSSGEQSTPDRKKWVKRLEKIRESIRREKEKDKLEWDFSDEIQILRDYSQDCPLSALTTRADEIREQLQQTQSVVEEEVTELNQVLAEIQEERKQSVRRSLRAVMEARGFKWKATGFVRSVGSVIGRPSRYQLNKGGERLYFIRADVYDLSNFRGREVAVSGEVLPDAAPEWDVPVLNIKTMKILE